MLKTICTGRLTKDLELRYTQDNKPIVILPLAIISARKNSQTVYKNFTVYGEMAKLHCEHLGKGSTVYVEGHLYQKEIEENGKKKREDIYYADYVEYLSASKKYKTEGQQVLEEVQNSIAETLSTIEQHDPFAEFGQEIQLSDDDLPWN